MSDERGHTDFERGVTEYSDWLRSFLRRRLGNDADAEDALQEIFYNLFRTVGYNLDGIVNLPAWLYRAARNMLANMSRRAPSMSVDESDFLYEVLLDNQYGVDSQLLRNMFWRELDIALAELPSEQRQVWELAELHGLSTKEIADIMQSPVATVLSRKYYAVKYLRKKLRRLYDDIIMTD